MKWEQLRDYDALSTRAAEIMVDKVRHSPRAVLGLPTGRTPVGMYQRVVAECGRETHCFRDVRTFNLDEYVGIGPGHPGSYASYMREQLFSKVDVRRPNTHIPDGQAADLAAECEHYEELLVQAGGLDLTFLGLGRNGHIGFNEPGTPFASQTRVVELTESTRRANADLFPDGKVPTRAITMGIGTILSSKRIVLLVNGESKREAVARLRSGAIDESFPASALWKHPDVTVLIAI